MALSKAPIYFAGELFPDEMRTSFRSLLWGQCDHMSTLIPAILDEESKDAEDMLRYRRLLFQLTEALDGIRLPVYPESLVRIGESYLSNLHIGAIITAMRSVITLSDDSVRFLSDSDKIAKAQSVKDFATLVLETLAPMEVLDQVVPA